MAVKVSPNCLFDGNTTSIGSTALSIILLNPLQFDDFQIIASFTK